MNTDAHDKNTQTLTVPVQRRPGYRTVPVAALRATQAEYGQDVIMIDALLYRQAWECVATVFILRPALRVFFLGAPKEFRKIGGMDRKIQVPTNIPDRDRPDHQLIAASGLFLRQPEKNQENQLYMLECVIDSTVILEESFVLKSEHWVPSQTGQSRFVREIVGTFLIQAPALAHFYQSLRGLV